MIPIYSFGNKEVDAIATFLTTCTRPGWVDGFERRFPCSEWNHAEMHVNIG